MAAVRIAYAHGREDSLDDYGYAARRSPEGLVWGVSSVECSVAGHFFSNLPATAPVVGPLTGKSASWCLAEMMTARPDSGGGGGGGGSGGGGGGSGGGEGVAELLTAVTVSAGRCGLLVEGYVPPPGGSATRVVIDFAPPVRGPAV